MQAATQMENDLCKTNFIGADESHETNTDKQGNCGFLLILGR